MERDTITGRQGYFLLSLFLLGNLVTASGAKSIHSGWLLFLALALVSIPLFWLYLKASGRRQPGMIFIEPLGTKIGGALTALYCVLAILLAGDAIRLFADFIVINDLNDAGAWGNTALLTITVLLLLYNDLESLGKAAWVLLPLSVLLLLVSLALTVAKMDLQRILPLFDDEGLTLLRGFSGSLGGLLAPAFFPIATLSGCAPVSWRKSVCAAGITVCILLALLALRDSAVVGYPTAGMFRFPFFASASITRHSEILISAVFVLSQPFRTALCLRYVQACLTWWKPRWKLWYPPVLLAMSIISGALSWSSEQVRWRTGGELAVILTLLVGPVAVVVADRVRNNKTA